MSKIAQKRKRSLALGSTRSRKAIAKYIDALLSNDQDKLSKVTTDMLNSGNRRNTKDYYLCISAALANLVEVIKTEEIIEDRKEFLEDMKEIYSNLTSNNNKKNKGVDK